MGAFEKVKNLFTINYDEFDDDYYNDDFYDDVEEPKKTSKSKKHKYDDFEDDEVYTKPSRSSKSSKKVVPMSSARKAFEVTVIKPSSYEFTTDIIDNLLNGKAVVLNLEGLKLDLAQRIVDSVSGGCYAISGNLQRVSGYIYLITPSRIEISGDIMDIVNGINIDASANTGASY
ncbi:MAG: cell division protein SepF [Methanobrevibacter sp.]|nr:cell division protein SepF [Methanobrevibacter sp.]